MTKAWQPLHPVSLGEGSATDSGMTSPEYQMQDHSRWSRKLWDDNVKSVDLLMYTYLNTCNYISLPFCQQFKCDCLYLLRFHFKKTMCSGMLCLLKFKGLTALSWGVLSDPQLSFLLSAGHKTTHQAHENAYMQQCWTYVLLHL